MAYSLLGSSVHGIFQAVVLEWIAIFFSRGSSQPGDRTWVSRIVDRCFTVWATRETNLVIYLFSIYNSLVSPQCYFLRKYFPFPPTCYFGILLFLVFSSLLLFLGMCIFMLCPQVMSNSVWPQGLYSPPGPSVHGISQARKLEWGAISSSTFLGIVFLKLVLIRTCRHFAILWFDNFFQCSKP